jgi:hypothetical protein
MLTFHQYVSKIKGHVQFLRVVIREHLPDQYKWSKTRGERLDQGGVPLWAIELPWFGLRTANRTPNARTEPWFAFEFGKLAEPNFAFGSQFSWPGNFPNRSEPSSNAERIYPYIVA